jgi:2,3-diketo-5-methylthio-1-phosphopentane phosphatase
MSLAVLTDFDGTVASSDASYAVLNRFGEKEWREIEKEALDYNITILDALKIQAGMVKVSPEEASGYLRENVKVREGFREFACWCRENDIHLEICSDGFGWTIEVLLKYWGLDWIPWTSNKVIPKEEGWEISFPFRKDGCPINANCKCFHYRRLKENYKRVIFIGDGTTDECVARKADIVYARDRLLEVCSRDGIDCIEWEDWRDISDAVECIIRDQ